MKLRHDFAGHYNRPDIFHLHINRSAPRLYSVHGERSCQMRRRLRWRGRAICLNRLDRKAKNDLTPCRINSMSSGVTTTDTRVTSAIHHWAPRFVAQGVILSDFEEVTVVAEILGRLVRRLVGARRRAREAWPRRAGGEEAHHRRRAPAARRRLLSFRQVPVRAGPRADEDRTQEGDRMPQPGAAVSQAEGRAGRDAVRRQVARRHPAQAGGRREAAGAGVRLRPRLLQGGDRDLRESLSRARHRHAGVRRARPGRRRIRFRHPRRLRGRGEGGDRLHRDAQGPRRLARRHGRHQPRRLLRAARGGVREAHQGLPGARRSLRMGG